MKYIISYDIPDDKRRLKIAKILLDFGARIQYSVFEADLDDKLIDKMSKKVSRIINEKEDNLIIYTICASCIDKKRQFGSGIVIEDKDVYIL